MTTIMKNKFNCHELIKFIKNQRIELEIIRNQFISVDSKQLFFLKKKLENIDRETEEILDFFEVRLTKEQLTIANNVYRWVGMESVDILEEYKNNNILLPTKEEYEAAAQNGYSELMIVPGSDLAEEFYNKTKQTIKKKNTIHDTKGLEIQGSHGIYDRQVKGIFKLDGLAKTGSKFYALLVNPAKEIDQIDPKLIGESPAELIKEMERRNQTLKYAKAPLSGMSLYEYVYFQMHYFLKNSGGFMLQTHPDIESKCWLLQKSTLLGGGDVIYLNGSWDEPAIGIDIDWAKENAKFSKTGPRFCVIPKSVRRYSEDGEEK